MLAALNARPHQHYSCYTVLSTSNSTAGRKFVTELAHSGNRHFLKRIYRDLCLCSTLHYEKLSARKWTNIFTWAVEPVSSGIFLWKYSRILASVGLIEGKAPGKKLSHFFISEWREKRHCGNKKRVKKDRVHSVTFCFYLELFRNPVLSNRQNMS